MRTGYIRWRLSRLGRRRRLKRCLKDHPGLAYLLEPRPYADYFPKHRWWQFWKRKVKITVVGTSRQGRGKLTIEARPDLIIVDDMAEEDGWCYS